MHLNDLLYCDDEQFVRNCYQSLLRRDPDREGISHYLHLLKGGFPREQVVEEMSLSSEGRQYHAQVNGLRSALWLGRLYRVPGLGPLLRRFAGARCAGSIEIKLAELEALSRRLILLAEDNGKDNVRTNRPTIGAYEMPSSLSPRARDIFEDLRG
jgi:hypothetical protein